MSRLVLRLPILARSFEVPPAYKLRHHSSFNMSRDRLKEDGEEAADFFGPQPPAGYASLKASASQILLPLTVSNKCGQAFRWREAKVYTDVEGRRKETSEWSLCLADRVVLLQQDEDRGYLYHRTLLPPKHAGEEQTRKDIDHHTSQWLRDYLNLDVPLEALYRDWAERDKVFARYAYRFSGLRMLRQDPWECLCAFICSSNNNIARIGQMVQNLCTHFSPALVSHTYPPCPYPPSPPAKAEDGEETQEGLGAKTTPTTFVYHPFPVPEALAEEGVEEKLRQLGFGYRAKYIARTAQMLCEKHARPHTALDEQTWLYGIKPEDNNSVLAGLPYTPPESPRKRARPQSVVKLEEPGHDASHHSVRSYLQSLRSMSYQDARSELLAFPGVGPKVADCVLLMSLDQHSSIPVDRHVFQFAEKWYHIRSGKYEDIAQRFRDLWGEYAGWAHSVLFTADLRSFATYKSEPALHLKEQDPSVDVKIEAAPLSLTPPVSQQTEVVQPQATAVKSEAMQISDLLSIPVESQLLTNSAQTRPKRKSRTS